MISDSLLVQPAAYSDSGIVRRRSTSPNGFRRSRMKSTSNLPEVTSRMPRKRSRPGQNLPAHPNLYTSGEYALA